jgi:hypothetical protein
MRDRTLADDVVQGAAVKALAGLILPPMRVAAKRHGYAIAVHGSLCRDLDLIAVPWAERCDDKDALVRTLCGAVAGVTGSCLRHGEWSAKPHGRAACILLTYCGEQSFNIDLSICARSEDGAKEKP